jgi:hypothetical protein
MAERRSLFEDLPVELIYLILEYLAPHDLFFTFKNLNRRFTSILNQQPPSLNIVKRFHHLKIEMIVYQNSLQNGIFDHCFVDQIQSIIGINEIDLIFGCKLV